MITNTKLGYKIPSMFDNQDIIIAPGINELYENTLTKLTDRKSIKTNYNYNIKNKLLNTEQELAVDLILNNGLSIITGQGGTGKTFTCNVVYENLLSNNIDNEKIQFLAFTNSAANVLSKNISGANVSTIHSFIDNDTKISNISDKSLDFEYIFVDEVSMLDFRLLNELLKKITDTTRIVLIGDSKQLKPVNGISILSDLIPLNVNNTVELIKNNRTNNIEIQNILNYTRNSM